MKQSILFLVLLSQITLAQAQNVGIGSDSFTPDASALLELRSNSSGLLIPRMTEAQRNSISAPAEGLMIYQKDGSAGFYYHDGAVWQSFSGGASDDFGNHTAEQTIELDDNWISNDGGNEGIRIANDGNVGIGTAPSRALHVVSNASNRNVVHVQSTASDGWSSIDFLDHNGSLSTTFGFANSGTGSSFSNRAYMNSYDHDFILTRNSSESSLFIKGSNGRVGVNTDNPQARLHVEGDARISDLSGSGTRMVVADANGELSTQAIPSGGGTSGSTVDVHLTNDIWNYDVSGVSIMRMSSDNSSNEFRGLSGGVAGQVIYLVNTDSSHKVKFKKNQGSQQFRDDLEVKKKEGAIIMYDGVYWYVLSKH